MQLVKECKSHGVNIKAQKVKSRESILQYLQTQPRQLLGCNNASLSTALTQTQMVGIDFRKADFMDMVEPEIETVTSEGTKQSDFMIQTLGYKPDQDNHMRQFIQGEATFEEALKDNGQKKQAVVISKTARKISDIKDFMRKYGTFDANEISKKIIQDGSSDELLEWRTIVTANYARAIMTQAVTEIKLEDHQEGKTYMDRIINDDVHGEAENMMDLTETSILFREWCEEQHIIAGDLLMEMYVVLAQKDKKRNCLMLQGASNAGMTFWTNALCPCKDTVGQTVQSSDFIYQKCLNKDVIVIPELRLTKPEQVEELKKVMEGIPTMINVKNKDPQILERTPILLTCNTTPWGKAFCQEEQAFRNRMHARVNLIESQVLKNLDKSPNPVFFKHMFTVIEDEAKHLPGNFTFVKEDPYWLMLSDKVMEDHQELQNMYGVNNNFRNGLVDFSATYCGDFYSRIMLSNNRDMINEAFQYVQKTMDEHYTGYHVASVVTGWLLAISEPFQTIDLFWDITDYKNPKMINCQTSGFPAVFSLGLILFLRSFSHLKNLISSFL